MNFVQCRLHRQGGRLFLLLAAFVILSLVLSVVGTGGMPGNVPVLFAQMENPPPLPLPMIQKIAGPFNGPLEVTDEERLSDVFSAGISAGPNVQDFDAEARFFNPYPTTSGSWDCGFVFRDLENTFYVLLVDSNGNWHHYLWSGRKDTHLGYGTSSAIDTSQGGSNHLKLMVRGDRGWFFINSQLVTTLDLSAVTQEGDLSVFATGSLRGKTRIEGFTVWAEAVSKPP